MRFREFHRNIRIRICVSFAFGVVQATTMPFMAVYFARSFGETWTGLLLAGSIIASMVSGAIGGYYADRIGRRRIMIYSEGVFLLAYVAMALANSPWLNAPALTFTAFLLTNICWGVYGPADQAMILDVTAPDNRQMVFALFYWISNLTLAIGTSVGAFLFESSRFALFGVTSLVMLGTWLTTIFFIEETYVPTTQKDQSMHPLRQIQDMFRRYRAVLEDRTFLRYILGGLFALYGEFQLQNYIGIHLAKTVPPQNLLTWGHLSIHVDGVQLLGWLQSENTVLVVLLAAAVARITRSWPERTTLFIGLMLQTLGYSVLTFATAPLVLLISMVFATIGEVTAVPVRQAFLGDIAPEEARSTYVAVHGMTFQGTRLLTSFGVALGAVIPAWGMSLLCFLIGTAGYLLYRSIVPQVEIRRAAWSQYNTHA